MIDIHAHIIPDLDDGPPDMETSIGMGIMAQQEGITAIVSTSHSTEAAAEGSDGIRARLDEVRTAWNAAGLDIRLELGVEIYLRPDTVEDLRDGRLWSLAGSRYVLVELPYQPWPPYAEDALFALQLGGYVPILAHPERYSAIQSDPARLYSLVERGVLAQVTASALISEHSPAYRRCAELLLRHNLVQFLSTDAHGTGRRSPKVREALRAAESLVGVEMVQTMVEYNPARVLANEEITTEPVPVAPRKGFFNVLFGRD
jgi:protein-tyrosine phosphatase